MAHSTSGVARVDAEEGSISRLSRPERVTLIILAATTLVIRAIAFFHYRFDSDEPQHLHVTWGWTAGYLQYRDIFDNHAPLFHVVTAPILMLVGERADVLLFMRVPMLILFAIVVACTFVIARRLYSSAVGARAVVLLMLFPAFFFKSLEYRNDNLWSALWMLSVVAWPHPFVSGLLLGASLAASLKTVLLVLALAIAAIVIRWQPDWRWIAQAAAGFVVVPAAVTGYFIWRGAFDSMLYGLFIFNGLGARVRTDLWIPRILVPVAAVALFLYLRRRGGVSFLAYFVTAFTLIASSYWVLPLVSPRDYLAVMPVGAILFASAMGRMRRRATALAIVGIVCIAALVYYGDRFENRTDEYITMMEQLLRLSRPGEVVADYKGELVFRRRAFYPAFEPLTRTLIREGVIRDTIAEDMIAARCHIAQADGPFWPAQGKAFLLANFIDLGRLRASGQWIPADGSFSIAIPGPYVVIDEQGIARGTLDGIEHSGSRELSAGPHRFDRAVAGQKVAVLWSRAFERGLTPFRLQDLDF